MPLQHQPSPRQRHWLRWGLDRQLRTLRGIKQSVRKVLRSALNQVSPQHLRNRQTHGGALRQLFIPLVITGQQNQLHPVSAGSRFQPLNAVTPVFNTA